MIAATTLLISCSKSFLDLTPISQIGASNFYKTPSDLLNAVNGAYGALQLPGQYTEDYYFLADYPDDDIESGLSASTNDFDQFERFFRVCCTNATIAVSLQRQAHYFPDGGFIVYY